MAGFLQANLKALAACDPGLSARLSAAFTGPGHYAWAPARSGEKVPALKGSSTPARPLHSLVDPQREGQRLISTVQDAGFLIFFGLGGGFAPAAALEREDIHHILIVDYAYDAVAELLDTASYRTLWEDPRVHFLVDPGSDLLEQYIADHYQPVFHRGIQVIPLRVRVDAARELFRTAQEGINRGIERLGADYSVQTHLGIRWFSNILRNLRTMQPAQDPVPPLKQVAICAAGPSLDLQLPHLAEERSSRFLIAVDTSLPALLNAGLIPDAVVSIDAQHISYYHFMQGLPAPLYLDLASPPSAASQAAAPYFFAGGHPLARYIARHWRPLPLVDTSGGNVTYAAVSLAAYWGATQVEVYGADFAYPEGRAYARGTYLYPFFETRQTRFSPLETQWSALLYRSPELTKIRHGDRWYYETAPLRRYRQLLEARLPELPARVIPVPGMGAPWGGREGLSTPKQAPLPSPDVPDRSWPTVQDFIAAYRTALQRLPALTGSVPAYLQGLTQGQGQILSTVLPLAAALQRRHNALGPGELLEAVRSWGIKKIDALFSP
ncbi:MAG: DUF115 domain-containing protein [Spirochaetaceae bacterium]|jgi:hypothetical protein|nr:DUF115 domain-containing protein [Spirochaetaceae bacterium]